MNRFDIIEFITSQRIKENKDKPWDWRCLSRNVNITWDIVQQNPDKPWHWSILSRNPNITWDIIKQHLDKPWNWEHLSQNPNITWNMVQQNPDKAWNWSALCCNRNFLCAEEDILAYYIPQKAASHIQKTFRETNMNPHYLLCQKRIYREFEELIVET